MKDHLQDGLTMVNEMQTQAADTLEALFDQTNQMDNIDNELRDMGSEMDRSVKLLRHLAMRLMTSRIVTILIVIVVVIVVVALFIAAFTDKKEDPVPPPMN